MTPFGDKIFPLPPGAQLRSHGFLSGGGIGVTAIGAGATINVAPDANINTPFPSLDCHQAGFVLMQADITQGATAGGFTFTWNFGAVHAGWIYIGNNVWIMGTLAAAARNQNMIAISTVGTLGFSLDGTPATHTDAPTLPTPPIVNATAFQITNTGAGAATINSASVTILTVPIVLNPSADNAPWA